MPDRAAQAVIRRFWGDDLPAQTAPTLAPIERFMQYKRLNNQGWRRFISAHGPEGAEQYRAYMRALGRELGLEE